MSDWKVEQVGDGWRIYGDDGRLRGEYATAKMMAMHLAITLEERDGMVDENEKLHAERNELLTSMVESLVDVVENRAMLVNHGLAEGWWCDRSAGVVRRAFHQLVELGAWEYHPDDNGYARPKEGK